VYWTRRLLLVLLAFALVFGIARLLGSGGSGGPTATPVGATPSTSQAPGTTPAASLQAAPAGGQVAGRKGKHKPTPTPLASPTGTCAGSDVVATPSVKGAAYAGQPVVFTMTLVTRVSEACTWEVSAQTLVVKVTSGSDRIWSTQECSGAVPRQSVVVRRDQPTTVAVGWNGQRSDTGCTRSTAWAEPGYYHVVAASFGSEPVDVQFELRSPVPRTITATPTPTRTPSGPSVATSPGAASSGASPTSRPTETPTRKPSAQR
jgi:hypothetical protein